MPYYAEPFVWNDRLRIGDTFSRGAVLSDDSDVAYDLTGTTGTGLLRREIGGEILATFTVTFDLATTGSVYWTLSKVLTAELLPGVYPYAIALTFADGSRVSFVQGDLTCTAGAV